MKSKLSIAVILLLTIVSNTRANIDPGFIGMDNFKRQFPLATAVSYKVKGLFTEVDFRWNDMALQAFYDRDGNLLATCRPVEVGSLPLSAQISLRESYPRYVLRDAIEYNEPDGEVSYYVTAAGEKVTYLLRVSTNGSISVFKKMRP
jgi:hypothetical protein